MSDCNHGDDIPDQFWDDEYDFSNSKDGYGRKGKYNLVFRNKAQTIVKKEEYPSTSFCELNIPFIFLIKDDVTESLLDRCWRNNSWDELEDLVKKFQVMT